ncbi:hypothetical protein IPJ72_01650 [Candidatus Peregrinibacteria bacterium]|nr:MAG: hypothetical protein IPJ72_01650 [Candidatus Peregrinibacteria bacterium]
MNKAPLSTSAPKIVLTGIDETAARTYGRLFPGSDVIIVDSPAKAAAAAQREQVALILANRPGSNRAALEGAQALAELNGPRVAFFSGSPDTNEGGFGDVADRAHFPVLQIPAALSEMRNFLTSALKQNTPETARPEVAA